jgi:NADH dehydrogenase
MGGVIPHVVIIGAGFGGIKAAQALKDAPVQVTVVDRRNHHLFQPLLYQVATATLNPSDIAYPIRSILRSQRNAEVLLAEVTRVDPDRKVVIFDDGEELAYDYLIVATGATHSYFGHDEWERLAPGLKTIEDATEIRRRMLFAFEAAEREDQDPTARREWLTFVVVGAGATGVEIAGALIEVAKKTLAADFRHIDPKSARVIVVEGGPRVLSAYPEALSVKARQQLEDLGVEVRTDAVVTSIDEHGVVVKVKNGRDGGPGTHEERINARTVLWAAGVKASPLGASLGGPLDRAGRVKVLPNLSVPGHPEIFVVGDLAAVETNGKPVPGVAPAAMQMGRYAASIIIRRVDGRPADEDEPFEYLDKGSLATIGRRKAVADLPGGIRLWGFIAWAAWLAIHIFFLIGFRNRVLVMIQWAWSYFTFQRGARLITGETRTLALADGKSDGKAALPPAGAETHLRRAGAAEPSRSST